MAPDPRHKSFFVLPLTLVLLLTLLPLSAGEASLVSGGF